ncbi:hypothetical protein JCM3774_003756 [Rhodotorula dairenensis]
MPKPEPDKIPIASPSDLRHERDALQATLALNETEDTWEKINRALKRFQAVVRGGATKYTDDCVALLRDPRTAKGLVRSIVSERGALSGTALELVASCTRLGPHFAPLLPVYLPPILRLFGRPNKVYTTRSAATVASIVKNTRLADVLRYVVLEWRGEAGKSASFREHAAATVAAMLGTDAGALAVDKDALERRIDDLEWVIKTGATGREPSVRSDMKKCWLVYKREWPDRVHAFTAPMSPTTRKYLKVDTLSSSAPASHHPAPAPPVARRAAAPPPQPHPSLAASTGLGSSSHAGPSSARPAPPLSRSHGPSSAPSNSSSTRAHPHHPHAPLPPPVPSLSSTGPAAPIGMGPPPLRNSARSAAAADGNVVVKSSHARTVSNSTASSSRSASRSEARVEAAPGESVTAQQHEPGLAASSLKSSTGRTGFKPTAAHAHGAASAAAASMTRPPMSAAMSSNNRPAGRALMTSLTTNGASASNSAATAPGTAAEPRKARRIAVVPPSATLSTSTTTTAPAAPTLARSHSSSTSTVSSLARSHGGAAPVPPPQTSAAPPSTVTAAATSTTTIAGTLGSSHAPFRPTRRPPGPATATGSNSTTTTTSAAARARPGVAPSAATLASRERRAARERERERKAAEDAAAAVAAVAARHGKDGDNDGRQYEMRRRREEELREVARKVPLPPPGPEEGGEEQVGPEVASGRAGAVVAEAPAVAQPPAAAAEAAFPSESAAAAGADASPVEAILQPAARAPSPSAEAEVEVEARPEAEIEASPHEQKPEADAREPEATAVPTREEERPVSVVAPATESVPPTPLAAAITTVSSTDAGAVEGLEATANEEAREHDHHHGYEDDDDRVEESVGMDSDYLVESQGTEGGNVVPLPRCPDLTRAPDLEPAAEPARFREESETCSPEEGLVAASGPLTTVALSPPPSAPSPPRLETAQGAAAERADAGDHDHDIVEESDVSNDTTMGGCSGPVELVQDSAPRCGGPREVEQVSPGVHPDRSLSMADEEVADDESVEEQALGPDQPYDDLPPSPLLSRSPSVSAAATVGTGAAVPPSSVHSTDGGALATPIRAATRSSGTEPAATYYPPSPSPGPMSRHDAPFTPVSRVVPVRFPIANMMPYSPEPFQTRSIILDTPPRFEQYAPVRLPQCAVAVAALVAENPEDHPLEGEEQPADQADASVSSAVDAPVHEATVSATHTSLVHDDFRLAPQSDREDDSEEEADDAVNAPTQPQGRFFADAADVDDDADTTFEDDDDDDERAAVASDARELAHCDESPSETDDEQSDHDVIPSGNLGDRAPSVPSSYDDSAVEAAAFARSRQDEEAEAEADLTAHEESSTLTELASSPGAAPPKTATAEVVEDKPEEGTDDSDDDDADDAAACGGVPASPAGTTLDFSDFNAPPSTSTPSTRERRPFWDESLLGDESANFELEQPGLRFHDETESEHSMASTLLGDFDISGCGPTPGISAYRRSTEPERPAANTEEAPTTVLQRSLRSRVVTVDLAASTSKTPARSTRTATARDALTELQQ